MITLKHTVYNKIVNTVIRQLFLRRADIHCVLNTYMQITCKKEVSQI